MINNNVLYTLYILNTRSDENLIVSCSRDRLVNVWDRKARSLVHTFQGTFLIYILAHTKISTRT